MMCFWEKWFGVWGVIQKKMKNFTQLSLWKNLHPLHLVYYVAKIVFMINITYIKKCLNIEQTYLGARRYIYKHEWIHEIIGTKTNTLRFFLIGKEGKFIFRTYDGWKSQIYLLQWKECWTCDIWRWYQEKGKRYH